MKRWKHFDPPQNQRVAQVERGEWSLTILRMYDGMYVLTIRDTSGNMRDYLESWPLESKREAMLLARRMMHRLQVRKP